MALSSEEFRRIYGKAPSDDYKQPIMVGHVMFIIVGRDRQGNFTNQWIFTDPVEPMFEVMKYMNTYPDLEMVEMAIHVPDKGEDRAIRIR